MRKYQIIITIPEDSWVKDVADLRDCLNDTNLWTATHCESDIEVSEIPTALLGLYRAIGRKRS